MRRCSSRPAPAPARPLSSSTASLNLVATGSTSRRGGDHVHREGGRRAAPPAPRRPERSARRVHAGPPRSALASTRSTPRPRTDRHAARVRPPRAVRLPHRRRPAARLHGARRARERPRVRRAVGRSARSAARRCPTRRRGHRRRRRVRASSASSTASGSNAACAGSPRTSTRTGTSSTTGSTARRPGPLVLDTEPLRAAAETSVPPTPPRAIQREDSTALAACWCSWSPAPRCAPGSTGSRHRASSAARRSGRATRRTGRRTAGQPHSRPSRDGEFAARGAG